MGPQFTRSLVEILSSTLQKLEERSDFRQDDPAVIELKKHIVRAIAELEVSKLAHSAEFTSDAHQSGNSGLLIAVTESTAILTSGSDTGTIATAAPMASSPETVVAEPPAEATEMPLLAENGTATST